MNELASLFVRRNERFHFSQQFVITSASLSKKGGALFWPKLKRRVIYLADLSVTQESYFVINYS